MKHLAILLSVLALTTQLFANRTYHPLISQIDIAFQSGDKVIFTTELNTACVKGIKIVSRKGVEYTVPTSAIVGIKAPRLDTLRITFNENSSHPYKEGSFHLFFNHGPSTANSLDSPDVMFFFEDGVYIGGRDDWQAYLERKHAED